MMQRRWGFIFFVLIPYCAFAVPLDGPVGPGCGGDNSQTTPGAPATTPPSGCGDENIPATAPPAASPPSGCGDDTIPITAPPAASPPSAGCGDDNTIPITPSSTASPPSGCGDVQQTQAPAGAPETPAAPINPPVFLQPPAGCGVEKAAVKSGGNKALAGEKSAPGVRPTPPGHGNPNEDSKIKKKEKSDANPSKFDEFVVSFMRLPLKPQKSETTPASQGALSGIPSPKAPVAKAISAPVAAPKARGSQNNKKAPLSYSSYQGLPDNSPPIVKGFRITNDLNFE